MPQVAVGVLGATSGCFSCNHDLPSCSPCATRSLTSCTHAFVAAFVDRALFYRPPWQITIIINISIIIIITIMLFIIISINMIITMMMSRE